MCNEMTRRWTIVIVAVCLGALLCSSVVQGQELVELPDVTMLADPDWNLVTAVNFWDGYLYLNTVLPGSGGQGEAIVILDVHDPANPVEVARLDGSCVCFKGDYMYLIGEFPVGFYGLHVVDISNPTTSVVVGNLADLGVFHCIEICGDYVYLLTPGSVYDERVLSVVEISDPTTPVKVAELVLPETGHHMALIETAEGPILYVPGYSKYMYAISVFDPTNPCVMGFTTAYWPREMLSLGDVLAITRFYSYGLQLVLFDGTEPFIELGAYVFEGGGWGLKAGAGNHHIYYRDQNALLGGTTFYVLDTTTPSAPVRVAQGESATSEGWLKDFAVSSEHVYSVGYEEVVDDTPYTTYLSTLIVTEALKVLDDVTWDYWAAPQIDACMAAAIVSGYTDGTYQPSVSVTRDQMAVFLSRAHAGGDEGVAEGPTEATFLDVPTDYWSYKYIEYCVAGGIVGGYGDGNYGPAGVVDRGQMTVFIARAVAGDGIPDAPEVATFDDVPINYWAFQHVEYCVGEGIVQGYDAVTYGPDGVVTRDQMAVFICRAFGLE